ncbi:MAG: ferric uptake regulator, Fur family [Acidimicrobiaceae bacterium]|nr:ferric uptake regulator, Fur family [Acidimicrobiaceae bacterium]
MSLGRTGGEAQERPLAATTAGEPIAADRGVLPGEDPVEEVLSLLRARGGRVTSSRRLLLRCLFGDGAHRTAEELAEAVQAQAPDVHLSTIYRNLDELERLGVVVHAHLGHGPATYHLASETHGHLVCESCGTMVEASEDLFASLAEEARERFGFVIDPRHFAVLGSCRHCAPPDSRV